MKSRPTVFPAIRTALGSAAVLACLSLGLMAEPALTRPFAAPEPIPQLEAPVNRQTRTDGYQLVRRYPHDATAFTQGLAYENGKLYESTGLYGQSTLRVVELETGAIGPVNRLHPRLFGEGLTVVGDRIIQLTWKTRLGLVFDKNTLKLHRTFQYPTEGWGLTYDGRHLIMSDGSATLTYLDPENFREVRRLQVQDQGLPVTQLNELEYIRGEIWANVWKSSRIARISPETGYVTAWVELSGLDKHEAIRNSDTGQRYVLNGIAYDQQQDRLWVTGKRWANIYEIRITPTN